MHLKNILKCIDTKNLKKLVMDITKNLKSHYAMKLDKIGILEENENAETNIFMENKTEN